MARGKWRDIASKLPKLDDATPEREKVIGELVAKINADPGPEHEVADSVDLEVDLESIGDDLEEVMDKILGLVAGKRYAAVYAKSFVEVKRMKEFWKEQEKKINLIIEAYTKIMVKQYEVEDASSIRLTDGSQVLVWPEPYAQVTNHDAYRQWCIDNGYEKSLSLPWQTTNSITKERLEAGLPEPTGITAYSIDKIQVRKGQSED